MISLLPLLALLTAVPSPANPALPPVLIGLDLELGHISSTSGEAVKRGVELAVEELNAAGGVLGGRPLEVVALDNRAVPARGVENLKTLAARPDLVAVLGGKYSPVMLDQLPLAHELEVPLLSTWAAADGIIDHGRTPSYTFRLSLRDSWAIDAMMASASSRGFKRVGLILPNTAWGRSCNAAAARHQGRPGSPVVVDTRWFNWGDSDLMEHYRALRAGGAQALLFVTNEGSGAALLKDIAALPKVERLPVLAHHGLVGGDLVSMAGPALHEVDLQVVQVFLASAARRPRAVSLLQRYQARYGVPDLAHVLSAGGMASAYDLTHILAMAIKRAGSTDRRAIRKALEEVEGYDGAVKALARPFTPTRHEALALEDVFMARFDADGALVKAAR